LRDEQAEAGKDANNESMRLILKMDGNPNASKDTIFITHLRCKLKKYVVRLLPCCKVSEELNMLHAHLLQHDPQIGLLEQDPADE